MALALGIDEQNYDEVATAFEEFGTRYLKKFMSETELPLETWCRDNRIRYAASRFAAKEAVFKLLQVNDIIPSWHEIEIHTLMRGRIHVTLHKFAHDLCRQQGITDISVSIALGRRSAIAAALAHVTEANRTSG